MPSDLLPYRRLDVLLREADIVLISDYDKGVCTPGLLAAAIRDAAPQVRGPPERSLG